jgi:Cupin/Helix-turn-helix domain
MGAPWGFGVEVHGQPAFQVVTSGDCRLEVDGEPGQLRLRAGDLVVLPTGRRHWLRDRPGSPAPDLERILAATPLGAGRRLRHAGDGPVTELVCGGFELEGAGAHPLLRSLPAVLHIRGSGGRPVPWLAATLALLDAETTARAPGAARRPRRVPERRRPAGAARPAGGRRDRAHPSPARARLDAAATLLRQTDAPLAEIATRAGYATPFSFNRAFKHSFGIAPGAYRGQRDPP